MSKITHDVFMSRVIENNKHVRDGDIEILGKYTRSDVPIECRCNVHNKIWNAHPRNLYDGSGCRLCGNELRAEKQILSQDSIQSRIDELNKWIEDGCQDGPGYFPPRQDEALFNPTNLFEEVVSKLNKKLIK